MRTREYSVSLSELAGVELPTRKVLGTTAQSILWLRRHGEHPDAPPKSGRYLLGYLPKHQEAADRLVEVASARMRATTGGAPFADGSHGSAPIVKTAKEEAREQKLIAEAAAARSDLERYGPEVASAVFAFHKVTIYERGFVKMAPVVLGGNAVPQRLVSIEASRDVRNKSAARRAAGFAVSGGLNMLTTRKKGDLYLTIVTDEDTRVLHSDSPSDREIAGMLRLEAAGQALLDRAETPATDSPSAVVTPSGSAAERLATLGSLLEQGLVTQEEFDEKRRAILDEI